MVAEQLLRDPALFARVQGMQVSHPLQVVEEYLEWPVGELCSEIAASYPPKRYSTSKPTQSLKAHFFKSVVPTFPYRLQPIDRVPLRGTNQSAVYACNVATDLLSDIVRNLRHCLALDSKECFSVWELRSVDVLRNHLRQGFAHLLFMCNVVWVMFL